MAAYTCLLDEATQKKALEELFEDPKNRQGAIDTFREWIKQQNHIKCPTDDVFLLGFLRAKHFSQLEAREALERFMTIRDKLSSWMKNLDPTSKEINDIIDRGPLQLLPRANNDGQKIRIFKPGNIDNGNKKMILAFGRLLACFGYYNFLCEESSQVHGVLLLADWTGQTMANELKMPLDVHKNISTMITKAFPARVKGIHMYNTGSLMDLVMNLITSLLTDKLKKRVHIHNHGLESLYKFAPMEILPEEYLPDEYTGTNAGSKQDMKDALKALFQKPEITERIKHLSSEDFYIRMKDKDTDAPSASFRKLNVD